MYTEFYGLRELPFALTPDPRYIAFTPSHREAMANLHYGIESGKGLIVVTGEVGTGKTTVLRWIMQRLDRTVLVAYIFNPRLTVPEFYKYLATLLDLPEWNDKSELLLELGRTLESRHARGLRTVLIIDEAHGLSTAVLEEVRLLSNFESDAAKQLQIVLTGQPELRDVLNNPELRQLKQRVALRCQIKALPNIEETERYITSRLLVAGAMRTDIFSPQAIDFIFRCSEGIPRNINNLCDNSLLAGYAAGAETVTRVIVEEVAETFDMLPRMERGRQMGEEREAPARVLSAASRAEIWSAGEPENVHADEDYAAHADDLLEVETNEAMNETMQTSDTDATASVNDGNNILSVIDAPQNEDGSTANRVAPDTEEVGTAFRRWDGMGE